LLLSFSVELCSEQTEYKHAVSMVQFPSFWYTQSRS